MSVPRSLAAVAGLVVLVQSVFGPPTARANGGPFVIQYPNGDPAAKGVLARLGPDLMPGRESRLEVIKEELDIVFGMPEFSRRGDHRPLVRVSAEYTIENPTSDAVSIDFGFPIVRGIYVSPLSMIPRPDVSVTLDGLPVKASIISNSAIYGVIRNQSRAIIEEAIADDAELARSVAAVRGASTKGMGRVRGQLLSRLQVGRGWSERDAALLVEYAGLDLDRDSVVAFSPGMLAFAGMTDHKLTELTMANLGILGAIGEQKATQMLAHLASLLDPERGGGYERVFTAWGGDVRERSVDLPSGRTRPRELDVEARAGDPTLYARVDYLDDSANLTDSERESCRRILKNLPVIFTFAPMNLIHYQVELAARSTHKLTVTYRQFAFSDTASPSSYQLAYVLHPASLWDSFGPIELEVLVPEGVPLVASEPLVEGKTEQHPDGSMAGNRTSFRSYRAVLDTKTGELLVAVDATRWNRTASKLAAAMRR